VFLRFILGALRYRKQRLFLSFAALTVAATLGTVLFGIYGSVERRLREEFRAYGANVAAVATNGTTVPLAMIDAARQLGVEAAPFLVTAGKVGNASVPVAGFVPAATAPITPYWSVKGERDVKAGECLAGENVAERLDLQPGARVDLVGSPCTMKGIVSTGGAEDSELLVPFETAAQLAGIHGAASLIEFRAPGERVETVRAALANRFPEADVRTIRAVAATESDVVGKVRAALFLLTVLILAITALCVSSNFSEIVLERAKEIGILKALGAAERKIAAFFLSESAALALVATICGYAAGVIAAAAIGRQIFGVAFHLDMSWIAFLSVAAMMLLVSTAATSIAAARVWSIDPAVILRGE
jgi:putative ABC transport system permease protein